MAEKKGLKGLEEWCRRVTEGYRDVHIKDMSHSWRDGLAFCAIIHHFVPDLIDYNSLDKENILHNNSLAFSIAEKQLGIPALLDAEDLVNCIEPDRLSIATYLSQLYQYFEGGGNKKFSNSSNILKQDLYIQNSSSKLTYNKSEISSKKYETCQSCKHRVFILERLMVDGKLYHRTCFKCYRCHALLKPGAYNEGEILGTYECTVCPQDEEAELSKSDVSENASEVQLTEKLHNDENVKSKETFQSNQFVSDTFTAARKQFLQNNLKQEAEVKLNSSHCHTVENLKSNLNNEINLKNTDLTFDLKKKEISQNELDVNLKFNIYEKNTSEKSFSLLKKPPIARKPDFSLISKNNHHESKHQDFYNDDKEKSKIIQLSKDENNDTSTTSKYQNIFKYEVKPFVYNQQEEKIAMKIKPLNKNLELKEEADNENLVKSVSGLPVIKSNDAPSLNRSLLRTVSEGNMQQTPKLSRLSEALLFPMKDNKNEDLENILHGKWSKQRNYQKMYNRSFSNLTDLKTDLSQKMNPQLNDDSLNFQSDSSRKEIENKLLEKDIVSNIYNAEEKEEIDTAKSNILSEYNDKINSIEFNNSTEEQNKDNLKSEEIPEISKPDNSKEISRLSDHKTIEYPIDLNPFGDEEEDEPIDNDHTKVIVNENYPDDLNPFDTSEDEERTFDKSDTFPTSSCNTLIDNNEYDRNFNPFYSSDDDDCKSNTSSSHNDSSFDFHHNYSTITELRNEIKKRKKAPPPPPPQSESAISNGNLKIEMHMDKKTPLKQPISLKPSPRLSYKKVAPKPPIDTDNLQTKKDSKTSENTNDKLEKENSSSQPVLNKTKQWRKKKRPAPSVPVPRKRQIKMIPIEEIKSEMMDIEKKQQDLERQGRELEMLIREREGSELSLEEEKAILELFELVNLKNALFRRQAELMYIKRSQRLEEEQVEIEFQIRCLMNKPADKRSEEDASKEEELLQRLLDVVEQRNEIVDTIEMDRKSRELQEDKSIKEHMDLKQTEMKEKWKGTLKKKYKHKDKSKSKGKHKKQNSKGDEGNKDSKHKKNWF